MALKIIANYSKRLGLPAYSSHQFSVSIEAELTSMDDIAGESARLYETLQASVDEQIRNIGFVPDSSYGAAPHSAATSGNGSAGRWNCSEKQRDLILSLIEDHHLDKAEIEALSQDRFGKGVKQLNKLEASGMIEELLERTGDKPARRGSGRNGSRPAYGNGGGRR